MSRKEKWDMQFLKRHISFWSMKSINFMKYIELDIRLPSHVGIAVFHCPDCMHDIVTLPFKLYPVLQETKTVSP
jgi:hypothetical protein